MESPTRVEGAPAGHPGGTGYRADIDGMRAVAVLAVLAFHAFPGSLPGGFVGVDVFFVISGFLITGLLRSDLERGTFRIRDFYARRVRRIFPALLLVLAACLVFGWFVLFPDEYGQLGRHVAGGAAFYANLAFWRESGYFDNAAETKPLLHLWSLGIEEQFYIVWPLLLLFAKKVRASPARWMAAFALASFAVNVAGLSRFPVATFYSPAGRAWELALGGLLAVARSPAAQNVGPREGQRRGNLEALAGAALLALAFALIGPASPFPGWWALLPAVGTALLIHAGPANGLSRHLLASRPFVAIGLISYPLYLWHWPLLSFARIVESKTPSPAVRAAALVLSFVLAALTYRFVERPFRRAPARRTVIPLCIGMLLVGMAGQALVVTKGLPDRPTVKAQRDLQLALLLPDEREAGTACRKRFGLEDLPVRCLIDDLAAPPTVAILGDSHADHLFIGLAEHFRKSGDNLIYLETRVPYWDVQMYRDPLQQATNGMLDIALRSPSIRTIVLSTKQRLRDRSPEGRQVTEAMRATLTRFLEAGKEVVVVRDVPRLDFEPRECIGRVAGLASTKKSPCAMSRRAFEIETARHDALLAELLASFPTVRMFDAPRFLCDAELCWAIRDGQLLYRDRDHLSIGGDRFMGRNFAAGLVPASDVAAVLFPPERPAAEDGELRHRRRNRRNAAGQGESGGDGRPEQRLH